MVLTIDVLALVLAAIVATILALVGRTDTAVLVALGSVAFAAPLLAGASALPPGARAIAAAVALVAWPLLVAAQFGPTLTVTLLAVAGLVTATTTLFAFDPLADRRCAIDCAASPLAVLATSATEPTIRLLDAGFPALAAIVGVSIAVRDRRGWMPIASASALFVAAGMSLVAYAQEPSDASDLPWNALARVVAAVAVAFVVAACGAPAVRVLRGRAVVRRHVRRLGAAASLDAASAVRAAVGDRLASLVYSTPDGWVTRDGTTVDPPSYGRSIVVRRGGEAVAAIVTGAVMTTVFRPALALALANERLRAIVLARTGHLRASRARIVADGDAARRVLERNLHDGAQQRLVALTFELRRARTRATGEEAERLDRALDMAAQALAELRDLAHGIFPAILPEAGLEAALELVATAAPVPVRIRSSGLGGALRPDVEMAAYRVVAEALEASGDGVEISVERSAEAVRLVIRIEDPGDPGVDSGHDAADRVGAIGGTVAKRREAHMRTTEVLLPCVS